MSSKSYRRQMDEDAADTAQKLALAQTQDAKARTTEPEPILEPGPEPTALEQFQEMICGCRNMSDAASNISPALLAEVSGLKIQIPYAVFGSVRAICQDCGWTSDMTWSDLALAIGQAQRLKRHGELLKGQEVKEQ